MFQIENEWQSRIAIVKKILNDSKKISLAGYSLNPGARPVALSSQHKTSFKDIVTEYDKKVEDFIVGQLQTHFKGEGILGEEGSFVLKDKKLCDDLFPDELLWVIDPIDGTTNYSRSYPYFCSTLALLQKINGQFEVVLGATLDPIKEELFYAAKGQGAYLNDEQIRVSTVAHIEKALFVTGFASEQGIQKDASFRRFINLTRKSMGVRRSGAAALDLAYVAVGRLDAFWESGLSCWDVAAGALLITEAGGKVTHFERDSPWKVWTGEILATNTFMHDEVKSLL